MEYCFIFSMRICITSILSVWMLYKWSKYFYFYKVQGYFFYMTKHLLQQYIFFPLADMFRLVSHLQYHSYCNS
jgi:hypothetical protein